MIGTTWFWPKDKSQDVYNLRPKLSVKASDFWGTTTNWNREIEAGRFRAPRNPNPAVTSTTSICSEKLHQSSGIDPLGEAKLRGKTPLQGTQSSRAQRSPSKPRRPFYTRPVSPHSNICFDFVVRRFIMADNSLTVPAAGVHDIVAAERRRRLKTMPASGLIA